MGYGLWTGFSNGMGSGLQHYLCFLAITFSPLFSGYTLLRLAQSTLQMRSQSSLNVKVKITGFRY